MGVFTKSLFSTIAVAALVAPALADDKVSFAGADALTIDDFIGTIEIKVKNGGDIEIVKTNGTNAAYPVDITKNGKTVKINSDEDPTERDWHDDVNWRKHHERAFEIYLETYPTLTISVPRGTDLSIDDAVMILNAGDLKSDVSLGGHIEGKLGDLNSADVRIHGSADIEMGDIADKLDLAIHGSGDFTRAFCADCWRQNPWVWRRGSRRHSRPGRDKRTRIGRY